MDDNLTMIMYIYTLNKHRRKLNASDGRTFWHLMVNYHQHTINI